MRRQSLLHVLIFVSGCVAGTDPDGLASTEPKSIEDASSTSVHDPPDEPSDSCAGEETYRMHGYLVTVPKLCNRFYMYQGDPPPDLPPAERAESAAINPEPIELNRAALGR